MKKAFDGSGHMKLLAGVAAVALWASIPAAGLFKTEAGASYLFQQTPTPTPSPTPTVSPTIVPTITPLPDPSPSPTLMG